MADRTRQIALVGDQSTQCDPYSKGDPVSWADIHGRPRDALVERPLGDSIEIRVSTESGSALVLVHPDELSPR